MTGYRRVYDWIVDTIHKIGKGPETKFLIDAQRKYEKALRNVGKTSNGGVQYLFAGKGARNANIAARQVAEDMLRTGKTPQEVWKATGWKFGIDQKWKFEIDDSKMLYDKYGRYHRNPDIRRYNELLDKVYFQGVGNDAEFEELQSLSRALKGVSMKPKRLGDLIEHEELFEAYPQLRDLKVDLVPDLKTPMEK